jgi:hypothetical protein
LESPLISNATPKTTAIVLKLSEPLLHNGYTLWLDNFYTSPDPVKFLNPCNMDRMGTMKICKKNMPKKVTKNYKRIRLFSSRMVVFVFVFASGVTRAM